MGWSIRPALLVDLCTEGPFGLTETQPSQVFLAAMPVQVTLVQTQLHSGALSLRSTWYSPATHSFSDSGQLGYEQLLTSQIGAGLCPKTLPGMEVGTVPQFFKM